MPASAGPAAVLVMARAPGRMAPGHALESLLGAERCAALERELLLRAVRWGLEVAPERVFVAFEPADAGAEIEALVGSAVRTFAQEARPGSPALAEASARVLSEAAGPLLIAWPDLPRWRADHASGALEDLADDCDVSVGPVFDGGFYLLALARPLPELFAEAEADWIGPDAMATAFAAAHRAGLAVGMLRAERGLRRPGDMRAALADPLTDPELRALLG